MHKKSIEAAEKLKDDDMNEPKRDKDEMRSESIAALRAKAQEHSAKVMEGMGTSGGSTNSQTPGGTNKNIRQHSMHVHSRNQYGGMIASQASWNWYQSRRYSCHKLTFDEKWSGFIYLAVPQTVSTRCLHQSYTVWLPLVGLAHKQFF